MFGVIMLVTLIQLGLVLPRLSCFGDDLKSSRRDLFFRLELTTRVILKRTSLTLSW
jgi:hypothetical protein